MCMSGMNGEQPAPAITARPHNKPPALIPQLSYNLKEAALLCRNPGLSPHPDSSRHGSARPRWTKCVPAQHEVHRAGGTHGSPHATAFYRDSRKGVGPISSTKQNLQHQASYGLSPMWSPSPLRRSGAEPRVSAASTLDASGERVVDDKVHAADPAGRGAAEKDTSADTSYRRHSGRQS